MSEPKPATPPAAPPAPAAAPAAKKPAVSQERRIWEGHPSQVLNLGTFIACGLAILLVIAIGTILLVRLPDWRLTTGIGMAILTLIPALRAAWEYIHLHHNTFLVTTERIIIRKGFYTRKTHQCELYRVRDIFTEEPIFLRFFNLENVVMLTSDQTTPKIILPAVPARLRLSDGIRLAVEIRRDRRKVQEFDITGGGT